MFILKRVFNFWLLIQLILTYQPNPDQSPTTWFCVELSSVTTHSSIRWYRIRHHKGVNCWLLRHLLLTKSSLYISAPDFTRNYHQVKPTVLSVGIVSEFGEKSISDFWCSYYQLNEFLPDLYPLFLRGSIIRHQPRFFPLGYSHSL